MTYLLRNLTLLDKNSNLNKKVCDLLIKDGNLLEISENITEEAHYNVIDYTNCFATTGWIDAMAFWGEPGYENDETIQSGANAALAGGFTHVGVLPNTLPMIDNSNMVNYIISQSSKNGITALPIATITKNAEGSHFSEMYELNEMGVVAFSDGLKPIQNSSILLKAMQYVAGINGLIIQIPQTTTLHTSALVNEGKISVQLGLPGQSIYAETINILTLIELQAYTNCKIHFAGISCKASIEIIKKAKEKGHTITCSTTPAHLYYTEDNLLQYDTNLKIYPPLRTENDKQALINAIKDGTIDCVFGHHLPVHNDNKDCEFETAMPGMLMHQNVFNILIHSGISIERYLEMQDFVKNNLFDIKQNIEINKPLDLTIFSATETFTFTKENNKSKSKNSSLFNIPFVGKIKAVIHKNKINIYD